MQRLPTRLLRAVLARAGPQSPRPALISAAFRLPTSRGYHHCLLLQAEQAALYGGSVQSVADTSIPASPFPSRLSSAASSLSSSQPDSVASSFAQLGDESHALHPLIAASLASYGYLQPTHIQQRAFLPIAQRHDVVLAAETGCGKTVAFLLPSLSALLHSLEAEAAQVADSDYVPARRRMTPRLIIVSINRELCAQIHAVVQMVLQPLQTAAHAAPTPSCTLLAGSSLLPTSTPTDILITTPSCLYLNLHHTPGLLAHASHLIFDEADLLLSSSTAPATFLSTLRSLRPAPPLPSPALVFVAATINAVGHKSVYALLRSRFPRLEWINSSLFHSNRRQVAMRWLEVANDEERRQQLMAVLTEERAEGRRGEERRMLVFCNTVERAQSLYRWLLKQSTVQPARRSPAAATGDTDTYERLLLPDGQRLLVGRFHKQVPIDERFALLNHFHGSTENALPPSARPVVRVLVCTNLAARGVDFVGVECVVQFDMALSTVEHLHRAGRTGRMQPNSPQQQPMSGRVVCLWNEQSDGLLVGEIRKGEEAETEEGGAAVLGGFSRRRSLRRKYKKTVRESIEAREESMQLTAGDEFDSEQNEHVQAQH